MKLRGFLALSFCFAASIAACAQTYTVLSDFNGPNGEGSLAPLMQASDGNFYGTTGYGGILTTQVLLNTQSVRCPVGCGTVFKITPSGRLSRLYTFCRETGCPDGEIPQSGLIEASDGNLYGTTYAGGNAKNAGTIFRITRQGALTTLYDFCSQPNCTDGLGPTSALIQASDGNLYGTTEFGGANELGRGGAGTVFKITTAGELTTLYSFCALAQCADGANPEASLVLGANGRNFYGTTTTGGAHTAGTVFTITTAGILTNLYTFCSTGDCTDGKYPNGLVWAADGNFYGTTYLGGNADFGTFFKMTPAGVLDSLMDFCGSDCAGGGYPVGALVQGSDGNFYGPTLTAGAHDQGVIYSITPSGTETPLYQFCSLGNCEDGGEPFTGLVQGTDRKFYGVTRFFGNLNCGSANVFAEPGCGTVFSLDVGLEQRIP